MLSREHWSSKAYILRNYMHHSDKKLLLMFEGAAIGVDHTLYAIIVLCLLEINIHNESS